MLVTMGFLDKKAANLANEIDDLFGGEGEI